MEILEAITLLSFAIVIFSTFLEFRSSKSKRAASSSVSPSIESSPLTPPTRSSSSSSDPRGTFYKLIFVALCSRFICLGVEYMWCSAETDDNNLCLFLITFPEVAYGLSFTYLMQFLISIKDVLRPSQSHSSSSTSSSSTSSTLYGVVVLAMSAGIVYLLFVLGTVWYKPPLFVSAKEGVTVFLAVMYGSLLLAITYLGPLITYYLKSMLTSTSTSAGNNSDHVVKELALRLVTLCVLLWLLFAVHFGHSLSLSLNNSNRTFILDQKLYLYNNYVRYLVLELFPTVMILLLTKQQRQNTMTSSTSAVGNRPAMVESSPNYHSVNNNNNNNSNSTSIPPSRRNSSSSLRKVNSFSGTLTTNNNPNNNHNISSSNNNNAPGVMGEALGLLQSSNNTIHSNSGGSIGYGAVIV